MSAIFAESPSDDIWCPDWSAQPYWWDAAAPEASPKDPPTLPAKVDVLVVGSGYTGLNAALETARGGRSTLVLDARAPGAGCSTRNGGQISTSVKPSHAKLAARFGDATATAIRREGETALTWIEEHIRAEGIACAFRRTGRVHAAHSPAHYDLLAAEAARLSRAEGVEVHVVPRAEQARELGTKAYHGGLVFPRHAALHPALYHQGLLDRVRAAGAHVIGYCAVQDIARDAAGFDVRTAHGAIKARAVVVATNGYTGPATPWLRRRVIPIGSSIIATEEVPEDLVDRLFPTDRIASDSRKVVYYYRASPDRRRILFGGRVSAQEATPEVSGPRLHAELSRLFPELRSTCISHAWSGTVAYTFDELAHIGVQDGLHYALGYCGSGVSMASYLGMRVGQQVLGLAEGRTAFDGLPFASRPLYGGRPWFLPPMVAWYRWRDQRDVRRAAAAR